MNTLRKDILKEIADYIEQKTGIVYSENIWFQLENRLEKIATKFEHKDIEGLWKYVSQYGWTPSMRDMLLDFATNNETSFFRDPSLFDGLEQDFIPQWVATGSRHIRLWCAASSTGQEIYSIAMLLEEARDKGANFTYEILGSDISERVLAQAKEGFYSDLEINRGISASRKARFFRETYHERLGQGWQVLPELKKSVQFQRINLVDSWPATLGIFDMIFCRNVLIYQQIEKKTKVVRRMHDHLSSSVGYLVLGGAESLVGVSEEFDQTNIGKSIVYRLKSSLFNKKSAS